MDQQLKQRLIGVTVIVALVVIFVPMLFDKTGEHGAAMPDGVPPIPDEVVEKVTIELPKSAEDMAQSQGEDKKAIPESGYKIIPLTDEPAPADKAKLADKRPQVADAAPVDADEGGPADEEDGPLPEEKASSQVTAGEEEDFPIAPSTEGKVEKPAQSQEAKKLKPVASPAPREAPAKKSDTPSAKSAKVAPAKSPVQSVKPQESQERKPDAVKPPAAVKTESVPAARKPVKTGTTEAGNAKPAASPAAKLPPQAAASPAPLKRPVETAGVPTAWVVQTGSFTTESKAAALVEKLRQSRYAAFIEKVQGNNGTIYRVKVGPELERGRAEQIRKQIEGSAGLKGIVVPQR